MTITVKHNNKTVIHSGNINILYDVDPIAEFDVEGLPTKLIFELIPLGSDKKTEITFDGEEDSVFFKHSIKLTSDKATPESGMLVPLAFATRPNGDDLYITWSAKLKYSENKERIIQLTYAFYEGEGEDNAES
ncbi:hypothetical protein [Leclercia adecarboxylata]|uniref:hypothetical protein n=1 Tax=Leclercia adecarboxylata TaxID=83655 RepID=UPI0011A77187|nr:hypothetical protein [Leclercia adecarboxylata]